MRSLLTPVMRAWRVVYYYAHWKRCANRIPASGLVAECGQYTEQREQVECARKWCLSVRIAADELSVQENCSYKEEGPSLFVLASCVLMIVYIVGIVGFLWDDHCSTQASEFEKAQTQNWGRSGPHSEWSLLSLG